MNVIVKFEGTLEELTPILQALQATKTATEPTPEINQQAMADEPEKFVTPEFLRRALERHPLSRNTVALLEALCKAEEDVFLSRETLRKKIGVHTDQEFTDQQLTGVIGAFGKRLHQTDGFDGASYFEYKLVDGNWHYRLPTALRDVVREILEINGNR
ncbi:MAG: hypothetical protein OXG26_00130 [Caldilineaceae bacterium]|nr:hypothetical protein [Caldilineaceae bacterium]